jgi:hypothetical protein
MIVPFAKGQAQAPQQAQPSETNMLMALATMHQMGRFDAAGNLRAFQGERLMYPDGKDKEGNDQTKEGPLNISPKPVVDPKAVGIER